jgi:heterogeneous nuclear ribonucleoprotein F/H
MEMDRERERSYQPADNYPRQDQYDDRRMGRTNYQEQSQRGPHNRERSPEHPRRAVYADENTIKFIKVKNLPSNCDKNKITDFFSSIPIAYASIALLFDQTGRFCQEAIIALNNVSDQIEALSQSGRYIFNFQILVEESTQREFDQAQASQKVFFSRDEKILVRMRGLPFSVKKEDVLMFYNGYDIVPDSVIIGEMSNGKKTGEGVILFKSEDEASRAVLDKNGTSMGRRWIELYLHPYSHFHSFYQAQHHEEFVYLSKYITDENKYRTLRVRGLPYSATK